MSETKTLWCCHVRGPDDVIPTPNYPSAARLANLVNADVEQYHRQHGWTENDSRMWAFPEKWPWDAVGHAEGLANPSPDYLPAYSRACGVTP